MFRTFPKRRRPNATDVSPWYGVYFKKRWSYFIRKVYETDPLVCPKCSGEMHIISYIDQSAVIKTILQHLGLWEESHAPPDRGPPERDITFDSKTPHRCLG